MDRTDLVAKLSSPALPGRYIDLCCMRRELPRVLGLAQSRGSPCRSSCHQHCTLAKLPGKLFVTSTLASVRWDLQYVCTLSPITYPELPLPIARSA